MEYVDSGTCFLGDERGCRVDVIPCKHQTPVVRITLSEP
jgi:hypothetical protein